MKTKREGPKNATKNTTRNAPNPAATNAPKNATTPRRREHNMAVIAEVTRRTATALERLRNTPLPPGSPWLLPGETEASVRRTIARLRAGTIVPADPAVDPLELADLKEKQQAYRLVAGEVAEEMMAIASFLNEDLEQASAEMMADAVATLHAAKQLPEAKNPDSEVGRFIREMDRARRSDTGNARVRPPAVRRPKGRKK
jgi:hypothetical protein